ncbi:MAG: NAD-dependent epimerase/dehydratase family protein [Proteobacteria bacterium]|nr:NAD-dependent epimerase/dehydratase family protein [Pseudomonadota bacterium]
MQTGNILIIGATGYVGAGLCRAFTRAGVGVIGLVRPHSRVDQIRDWVRVLARSHGAELHSAEVARIIQTHDVRTVINCAWNMPPESTVQAQYAADRIALEAALDGANAVSPDVHVITTSGNFSLLTAEGGRITERPPAAGFARPSYMAWADTLSGVNILKDGLTEEFIGRGGNASILYPGSVYGPSPGRGGFWDFAIQQFISGKPHWGFAPFPPDFMTAWVHVDDLAECYVAAARRSEPGGHYLAAPENVSIGEMAALFAAAAGVPFEHKPFSNPDGVFFDDTQTRAILGLRWAKNAAEEVPRWVARIRELNAFFL